MNIRNLQTLNRLAAIVGLLSFAIAFILILVSAFSAGGACNVVDAMGQPRVVGVVVGGRLLAIGAAFAALGGLALLANQILSNRLRHRRLMKIADDLTANRRELDEVKRAIIAANAQKAENLTDLFQRALQSVASEAEQRVMQSQQDVEQHILEYVAATINTAYTKTVGETKRITDKFTHKAISAQQREFDRFSAALAGELRLVREESLAASQSRVRILDEVSELRATLDTAGITGHGE